MANRLAGRTLIVDSAAGNATIISTLSNSLSHITDFHVNAVAFWSGDTTGLMQLSEALTTDVIVKFSWLSQGSNASALTFVPATQSTQFGQQQPLANLKMPTLVAGTAWIYLA